MTDIQKTIGKYIRKVYQQQKPDSVYFDSDGGVAIQKAAGNLGMTQNNLQTEAETMEGLGLLELTVRPSGTGIKHTTQLLNELATIDSEEATAQAAAAEATENAKLNDLVTQIDALSQKDRNTLVALSLVYFIRQNPGIVAKYNIDIDE